MILLSVVPSPLYVSSLVSYLSSLTSFFNKCTILGDFNLPDVDWYTLTGSSSSSSCVCNFIFDCNLTQHVLEPTHVKGNVLDLVLTSVNVTIDHLTIHPLSVINFSDHLVISFCLSIDVPSVNAPKPGFVFDIRKADFESISSFLLDLDFI